MPNQLQMFFDNKKILVTTIHGKKEVSAESITQLAVHHALVESGESEYWAITHCLSGRALLTGIEEYPIAISLATKLEVLDLDTYWRNGCCASHEFYESANHIIQQFTRENRLAFPYRITNKLCEEQS